MVLHQQAVAVAKGHIAAGDGPHALVGEQHVDAFDDLCQLTAISACVHAHAAAHTTGDAVGEFQPRQSLPAGIIGHPGQRRAGLRPDAAAVQQPDIRHVAGVDHQPVDPLVGEQQIGAVAQHEGPRAAFTGEAHQQYQLLGVPGEGHPPGRAADAEGGVFRQRFLRRHGKVRQIVPQFFVQKLIPTHTAPPCDGCFR